MSLEFVGYQSKAMRLSTPRKDCWSIWLDALSKVLASLSVVTPGFIPSQHRCGQFWPASKTDPIGGTTRIGKSVPAGAAEGTMVGLPGKTWQSEQNIRNKIVIILTIILPITMIRQLFFPSLYCAFLYCDYNPAP
jgi:hypothetical protein